MSINYTTKLIIVLFSATILILSIGSFTLWNHTSELNRVIYEQNRKLSSFNMTIMELNHTLRTYQTLVNELNRTVAVDSLIQQGYRDLFFSNITPPITKLDAVRIALNYANWTDEELSGKMITATLKWIVVSHFEGHTYVFESIREVTYPKDDYSPEYEGGLVFRYAWQVVVAFAKPSDLEYWVDASNGEFFTSSAFFHPN
jgi:hypothetical protein